MTELILQPRRKIQFEMEPGVQIIKCESEEQWLQTRSRYVTASDASAIFGLNKNKSALELYAEKIGVRSTAHEPPMEQLEMGHMLEEPVAAKYSEVTGRELADLGRWTLIVNGSFPLAAATLDRLVCRPNSHIVIDGETIPPGAGVLECKSTGGMSARDWEDRPPIRHSIQLQHQMMVADLKWGSLAAIIGTPTFAFRYRDFRRDDDFVKILKEKIVEFMDMVERRTPPQADASESATRALKLLYPEDNGLTTELDGSFIELDQERQLLIDQMREKEKRKDQIDNSFKQAIGENSYGLLPNGVRYTYLTYKREEKIQLAGKYRSLKRKKRKGS